MKKLVMMFVILVAPFAITSCNDESVDDVRPQAVDVEEVGLTDDEEADDRGND